nr:unnamed protein product [Digitaria exilis]
MARWRPSAVAQTTMRRPTSVVAQSGMEVRRGAGLQGRLRGVGRWCSAAEEEPGAVGNWSSMPIREPRRQRERRSWGSMQGREPGAAGSWGSQGSKTSGRASCSGAAGSGGGRWGERRQA